MSSSDSLSKFQESLSTTLNYSSTDSSIFLVEKDPVKVNKWNAQEVRVALDDAITKYMNDVNGYAEDHSPINIRLAWSLLMNLAVGAVLLYSYLKGFNETKWMLAIASPLYLLSAGAYNLWNSRLSVPTFYRGASAQKKTVWLCSEIELPAANYILTPMVGSGTQAAMSKLPTFKTCIGNWITEDGFVDAGALESDLAKLKFSQLKSD